MLVGLLALVKILNIVYRSNLLSLLFSEISIHRSVNPSDAYLGTLKPWVRPELCLLPTAYSFPPRFLDATAKGKPSGVQAKWRKFASIHRIACFDSNSNSDFALALEFELEFGFDLFDLDYLTGDSTLMAAFVSH